MRPEQRGGHNAKATCETTIYIHWLAFVEGAVIAELGPGPTPALGYTGDWLRNRKQRSHLQRAYTAGEPVWMAADVMIQSARRILKAAREVKS